MKSNDFWWNTQDFSFYWPNNQKWIIVCMPITVEGFRWYFVCTETVHFIKCSTLKLLILALEQQGVLRGVMKIMETKSETITMRVFWEYIVANLNKWWSIIKSRFPKRPFHILPIGHTCFSFWIVPFEIDSSFFETIRCITIRIRAFRFAFQGF